MDRGGPRPGSVELDALLEAGDLVALGERMAGPLEFGTAGFRGAVGAGPSRMNRAVIIRTTRGLADVLLERSGGRVDRPVVVERDARLSSEPLADTVGVLAAARFRFWSSGATCRHRWLPMPPNGSGLRPRWWSPPATTPADNGYKVYDSNSAQIIPPLDQHIADAIERVGPAAEVPMLDPGEWARSVQ